MKPKIPTKAVCSEHLELRKEILTLLNLQKQVICSLDIIFWDLLLSFNFNSVTVCVISCNTRRQRVHLTVRDHLLKLQEHPRSEINALTSSLIIVYCIFVLELHELTILSLASSSIILPYWFFSPLLWSSFLMFKNSRFMCIN